MSGQDSVIYYGMQGRLRNVMLSDFSVTLSLMVVCLHAKWSLLVQPPFSASMATGTSNTVCIVLVAPLCMQVATALLRRSYVCVSLCRYIR